MALNIATMIKMTEILDKSIRFVRIMSGAGGGRLFALKTEPFRNQSKGGCYERLANG